MSRKVPSKKNLATRSVRAGLESDAQHGSVVPPIYLSTNFAFEKFGKPRKYDYTRSGNPTRDQLADALDTADGLTIVPGLRNPRGPDVMRGEETQIVGLMARHPAAADATVLLPGTHSKWASLRQGRVVDFCTLMTGELFALLRQHSILAAGVDAETVVDDGEAFLDGVRQARDSGAAGALSRLFVTRARMLDGDLQPASIPDYLSGLLIGEEFRSMRADQRMSTDQPLWLIGDAALCTRYRLAAAEFSIALAPAVDDTAAAGLWWLARAAGLLGSTTSHSSAGVTL